MKYDFWDVTVLPEDSHLINHFWDDVLPEYNHLINLFWNEYSTRRQPSYELLLG
jgi:hypothetical protein